MSIQGDVVSALMARVDSLAAPDVVWPRKGPDQPPGEHVRVALVPNDNIPADLSSDVHQRRGFVVLTHVSALGEYQVVSENDAGTIAEIANTSRDDGMVLDPHSAVGISAARRAIADGTLPDGTPVVALACAHPAKFQNAVEQSTGTLPALPAHLADLMRRPERKHLVEASDSAVKALVLERKRSL